MQRHAVQRPDVVASRERGIGGCRIAQRLVGADGDEAVEGRLRPVGPVQRGRMTSVAETFFSRIRRARSAADV